MENTGKEKDEKEGVREEGEWKGARVQCNQLTSGATRAAMGHRLRKAQEFNY